MSGVPFRKLPLSDSFMFGEVMRNPEMSKLFLEELLQTKIARLEVVTKEKTIDDTLYAHGIRLDVYLADANNTHYDIEMQNSKDALERRSRYYQSGIDRYLLDAGKSYHALPESFIIFVCNYDPLGIGNALYERVSYYKGTNREYNDGSHVLILNTHYTDASDISPAMAEYLNYIRQNDDSVPFTSGLANMAKKLTNEVRNDEQKGVAFMTMQQKLIEVREEARIAAFNDGEAKGRADMLFSTVRAVCDILTPAQISERFQISIGEVQRILNAPEYKS